LEPLQFQQYESTHSQPEESTDKESLTVQEVQDVTNLAEDMLVELFPPNAEAQSVSIEESNSLPNDDEILNWISQDLNSVTNNRKAFNNFSAEHNRETIPITLTILPLTDGSDSSTIGTASRTTKRSNAERCKAYRMDQKKKKIQMEEELQHEKERNLILRQRADSLEKYLKILRKSTKVLMLKNLSSATNLTFE